MSENESNTSAPPEQSAPLCEVCKEPLGEFEIHVELKYHRDKCTKCYVCKNEVSYEIMHKYLKGTLDYIGHPTCHEKFMRDEIEKRPITVTQGMLDYLNNISLMSTPELSRSLEDNESIAESAGTKQWLHMSSLEEKFVALRKMQAVCATWSVLLSNDKKLLNISIRREELQKEREKRHSEKMEEVVQYREGSQRAVELKREQKRVSAEKKTPDWKAVQGLMASGLSEEEARAFITENKAKQQKIQTSNSNETIN